jgi:predicted AlkP superfamily phosphohydrolase/phosphomutase
MSARKVFVLGLDGATLDIIRDMIGRGKLPAFRRMMQEGAWGNLESVPNQRSAAAWTTFQTGTNPGKHGIYEFYDYCPESYNLTFINAGIRTGASFWGILGNKGHKVGVINVPMTYPAEKVNGFLVAGLDCPSVDSPGFTHPDTLRHRLERDFGSYTIEPGLTGAIVGGRIDEAVRLIEEEITQKIEITRSLMRSEPWNLFVTVLRSLDAVQHTFWKYMDPRHPDHDSTGDMRHATVITDTYEKIDGFLGELIGDLDSDTTLLVMSDHGFGPKTAATSQINPWLASQGLLTYSQHGTSRATHVLRSMYGRVVGMTSRRMKEKLWNAFPWLRDRVQSRLCFAGIDWRNTRAYSDALFANVRVNLRGRERDGIVEPGDEYEELVSVLVNGIRELKDTKTGESIVENVFRKEDIYSGSHTSKAPDILIRWREDIFVTGIAGVEADIHRTQGGPPVPGEDPRIISGDHHLQGILMARGPDVKAGLETHGARLMDLAPTVLYGMHECVPADMDGRVLTELFESGFVESNPIQLEGARDKGSPTQSGNYTRAEEEAIHRRMRDLGYVE